MASLYTLDTGLKIVIPEPLSGGGGQALTDNFQLLDNHVLGTGTQHREPVRIHTGGTKALVDADRQKIFVNTGATSQSIFELPNDSGVAYSFIVNSASGIVVSGDASSQIQVGDVISISGGVVQSTTVGSTLSIVNVSTVKWVTTSLTGTWQVETS